MDPSELLASIFVSLIGFAVFLYGKRMARAPHLAVGLVLMVYSYFLSGFWLITGIALVLLALLWVALRLGW